ncbi:MAG: hypothetical protein HYZ47_05080, partial [Simkania negevensis]|nr:hypothetical protein [Simkania negevensis]
MSLSVARYHDIYCIRDVLFSYLECEKERVAVQALFDPKDGDLYKSTISSPLGINLNMVQHIVVGVLKDYIKRSQQLTSPPLKKRCLQDIAKQRLSKFYDGLVLPSHLSICLLMSTEKGYEGRGDLSFIIKLAKGLMQWGAQVSVVTNQTEQAKDLLKDLPCTIVSTKQSSEATIQLSASDLVIEAPIFSHALDGLREGLKKHNFIQMREYGFSPIAQVETAEKIQRAMGLGHMQKLLMSSTSYKPSVEEGLLKLTHESSGPNYDELGIFVDRELYKKSRHFTQQVGKLGRSAMLQEGVTTIACPCLKKALSSTLLVSNNPILYFGYGEENYQYFVEIIAELESRNTKELRCAVICMVERLDKLTIAPLMPSQLPSISSRLPHLLKKLDRQKKLDGFSDIRFIHAITRNIYTQILSEKGGESLYVLPEKGKLAHTKIKESQKQSKSLTVISIPYLPLEDMHTMQALAEDLILSTGDQSTSEAISADKIWLYDLPAHKTGFLDGVMLRASRELEKGQKCTALLDAFIDKDKEQTIALLQDKPPLLKQFKKLNAILRSRDLLQE